jgi:predicted outer membrane repeat protein
MEVGMARRKNPRLANWLIRSRVLRIELLEERRMLAAYLVNTELDSIDANDGLTSLREALVSSNAVAGPDTINFDASLSGKTILLMHGELLVADSATIDGLGANQLTIDASGNDPTPTQKNEDGSRVFNVAGPGDDFLNVLIDKLTITGGDSAQFSGGGAICNQEDLTLTDCAITNNSGYKGGAVATEGPLHVVSCVISGNASYRKGGGAIYADSEEPVSVTDSTITGNTSHSGGGAIYQNVGHTWGWITVTNSSITHNTASGSGGGILADLVTIDASEINNNASTRYGGGVYASGITITSSTVNDNSAVKGGGVLCDQNSSSIAESVFSGNSAQDSGGAIYSGNTLTISNTTIESNVARWCGGGIYGHYDSVITVAHSAIRGNSVTENGDSGGGGIFSRNSLLLSDSVISGNMAAGGGGGIFNIGYLTRISRCTITGNSAGKDGGGVEIRYYYLELKDSDVSNNTAGGLGGGIDWGSGISSKPLVIDHSTISGNSAGRGGGLRGGGGTCNITQSVISKNSATYDGGGIFNMWGGAALTVTGSTISGNTARNGGGIYTYGVTLVNCLVTNNAATQSGGGIYSRQSILRNSTITANTAASGGGVFLSNSTLTISDTIVARNIADPGAGDDVVGPVSTKFSLIGNSSGATIADGGGNLIGTQLAPMDPLLGPLTYNGGPTFLNGSKILSRVLLPGSPAINAGNPASLSGSNGVLLNDQRGGPFTRVAGRVDIGAIESQGNPLPGDYDFDSVVDSADYLVWRRALGSQVDLRADGNGDGVVNAPDFDIWRTHFGDALANAQSATLAETLGETSAAASMNQPVDDISDVAADTTSGSVVQRSFVEPLPRPVTTARRTFARPSLLTVATSSLFDLITANEVGDLHRQNGRTNSSRREHLRVSKRVTANVLDDAFASLATSPVNSIL